MSGVQTWSSISLFKIVLLQLKLIKMFFQKRQDPLKSILVPAIKIACHSFLWSRSLIKGKIRMCLSKEFGILWDLKNQDYESESKIYQWRAIGFCIFDILPPAGQTLTVHFSKKNVGPIPSLGCCCYQRKMVTFFENSLQNDEITKKMWAGKYLSG